MRMIAYRFVLLGLPMSEFLLKWNVKVEKCFMDFARGAEQFVDYIQVDAFVPMHFWNRPDEVKPFGAYARRKGVRYVLLAYPGEEALFL